MARPREFDIDAVLERSMKVFWAQGYKATSMEDLMQATRLQKQSFYNAFGDKKQLFLKSLALYRRESAVRISEALDNADSAMAGLTEFFMGMTEPCDPAAGRVPGCLMVNASLEFGTEDPEVLAELQLMYQGFENLVARTVRKGQEAGEITRAFDAHLIAKNLINTVAGLRISEKRGEPNDALKAIMRMALDSIRT